MEYYYRLLEDLPESYYWAGFLMADGCSNKPSHIRLQLANKDKSHLIKYGQFIGDVNIKCTTQKLQKYPNKIYRSCYLDIYNYVFVTLFKEKFDWKNKKTYNPPNNIILNVDDKLFLSFLIGYIDGDGCIQYQTGRTDPKISLHVHSSWLDFVTYINNRLNIIYTYTHIKPPHILNNGFVRYDIGCMRTIRELKKFAIDNDLPILERKWNKIDLNRLHKFEKRDLLIQQIKELRSQGYKLTEVAQKLNINYDTMCSHIYHKNIKSKTV